MRPALKELLPDAHMPGFVHGEDLARWYASSDIFAFPSTTETFGNVILESFASGIPAVGVAAGGVGDIINHEVDGLIAKPKDPQDFANKLEHLLVNLDYAKTLGQRARFTAQQYSWRMINNRLLGNYREFIARARFGEQKPALAA
jgi:glycosyltransferase involved in cell wall biosynthesis